MATPIFLTRSTVLFRRYMFLSVLVLIFIALVHHLHAGSSQDGLTTTNLRDITSHLPSLGLDLGTLTGPSAPWRTYPEESSAAFCRSHKHLETLGLTRKIRYSRRCIQPRFDSALDRNTITNTSAPLLTHTALLDLNTLCDIDFDVVQDNNKDTGPPCDTVEVPVPPPDPETRGQYAHLVFGVATSYHRLRASRDTFAHWLAGSGATLVGRLTDPNDGNDDGGGGEGVSDGDIASLEAEYADARMGLKIVRRQDPRHTTEQAHTLVIRDMLAHVDSLSSSSSSSPSSSSFSFTSPDSKGKKTKKEKSNPPHHHNQNNNNFDTKKEHEEEDNQKVHWLAILDDDTFLPSLHHLAAALATHDHTRPRYLGQLTEAASLLPQGILGAFGGAGIFLSVPLARLLRPHLESCVEGEGAEGEGGDVLIMRCVHAHSAARLVRVPGLWQVDLVGDTAGFYESGLGVGGQRDGEGEGEGDDQKKGMAGGGGGVLSLHHWKSWHWSPVVDMAAVTKVCGGGCFLERFVFLPVAAPSSDTHTQSQSQEAVAVVNNGYSINFYSNGPPPSSSTTTTKKGGGSTAGAVLPDLTKMEQTWDAWPNTDARRDYEWSLGPLRARVETGRKKSFWLAVSVWGGRGGLGSAAGTAAGGGRGERGEELTQVYVHRSSKGEEEGGEGVDEVIELVWLSGSSRAGAG